MKPESIKVETTFFQASFLIERLLRLDEVQKLFATCFVELCPQFMPYVDPSKKLLVMNVVTYRKHSVRSPSIIYQSFALLRKEVDESKSDALSR